MKKHIVVFALIIIIIVAFSTPALADYTDSWTDSGNYSAPQSMDVSTKTISISTPKELSWISWKVMNGTTFEGYTIRLEADVDLAGHNWQPIGGWNGTTSAVGCFFAGTFDGQLHTILNMKVERGLPYNGLFGVIRSATIKNILLSNCTIKCPTSKYSSGLIGYCSRTANEYSSVSNCGVTGVIEGNSYSAGFCGYAEYRIAICNSFVKCSVLENGNNGAAFGVGKIYGCWYDADLCSKIGSQNYSEKFCYGIHKNDLQRINYVDLLNEFWYEDGLDWKVGEDGYPALSETNTRAWKFYAKPISEQNGCFYVSCAEELAYISKISSSGTDLTDKAIVLMSNIDLAGKQWTPITAAGASFDGNGKTISNLTIYDNCLYHDVGLFENCSTIMNVTLLNPVINGEFGTNSSVGIIASNCRTISN